MKISSIVLLLAIIGASLQQTAPAPSCSRTDTANNNRFALKWLEDKKVTIHSTPQTFTDTTVCGGEWASLKTCCDLQTLKDLIKSQNDHFVSRWKSYIIKLSRVRTKLISGIQKLVPKLTVSDIGKRWLMIEKVGVLASRFSETRHLLPGNDQDLAFLKSWATKFEDNIKMFKEQGKKCFETMKKVRAGIYCAVCSGKSSTYADSQSDSSAVFKIKLSGC